MSYAHQQYLEGAVFAADPVGLVRLLYGGAIESVQDARDHLRRQEIELRGRAVAKAMAIVNELITSLNHEVGGELSRNLADLYQYMNKRLFEAHLKQSDEMLQEVEGLLRTMAEAWVTMPALPEPVEVGAAAAAFGASAWGGGMADEVGASRGWSL